MQFEWAPPYNHTHYHPHPTQTLHYLPVEGLFSVLERDTDFLTNLEFRIPGEYVNHDLPIFTLFSGPLPHPRGAIYMPNAP